MYKILLPSCMRRILNSLAKSSRSCTSEDKAFDPAAIGSPVLSQGWLQVVDGGAKEREVEQEGKKLAVE